MKNRISSSIALTAGMLIISCGDQGLNPVGVEQGAGGVLCAEQDGRYHLRTADAWKNLPASLRGGTVVVSATQKITGSFDGRGSVFVPGSGLLISKAKEPKKGMFDLCGATVSNMILNCQSGSRHSDGFYAKSGTNTLNNIKWSAVGEDGLCVKGTCTVTINGGSANGYTDKLFQINRDCSFNVKGGFIGTAASNGSGKGIRTNGSGNSSKTMKVTITVSGGCQFYGGHYGICTNSKNTVIKAAGVVFSGQNKGAIASPVPGNVQHDPEDKVVNPPSGA